MKRTLLFSVAVLAALFAGCDTNTTPEPEPNPTDAYVPLAQGNEWDYAWDLPEDGDPLNWKVIGQEDGAWQVELNWGDTTEEWLWRHTAAGEFQAKPADEENWRTYLKTPIEVDTEWTFTDDDGQVWFAHIMGTDEEFDLPAGHFDGLVLVGVNKADEESDSEYQENYWFGENVGIVRVSIDGDDDDYNSEWLWELDYYSLK